MDHEARSFALAAHGSQKYGSKPYIVHLDAVAELAREYGPVAQSIAYLHDVVEDTGITVDEVRTKFGEFIANCVNLLTDEPGPTRQERKVKTYSKLSLVNGPEEIALIVKAADRLANVRACVEDQKLDLLRVYRAEHQAFRMAAYRPGLCESFWGELDRTLSGINH